MQNLTLYGITVVPAILGIVQVGKQAGLPSRLAPLLSLALGIAAGLGEAQVSHLDYPTAIAAGIALGLSASGLYSGAQAVTGGGQTQEPAAPQPATTTTVTPTTGLPPSTPAPSVRPVPKRHTTRSSSGKFVPTPPAAPQPPSGSPPTAK